MRLLEPGIPEENFLSVIKNKVFPSYQGEEQRFSREIMVYARTAHVMQKLVFHFSSVYSVYGF